MQQWSTLAVLENKLWTNNLFSLKIKSDNRLFTAGQFTKLGIADAQDSAKVISRAYSYVNAPQEPFLEFYLTSIPAGLISNHLYSLRPGDTVSVLSQSTGFMTLEELPDKDSFQSLWLLATGTAVGPFVSLLRQGAAQRRFQNIVLVHAARYSKELAYSAEIIRHAKHSGNITYIPCVSREAATTNAQQALTGRIPKAIATGALQACAPCTLRPESAQVMLCGNPAMIKDTTQELQALGFTKNRRSAPGNITTEQYWNAK